MTEEEYKRRRARLDQEQQKLADQKVAAERATEEEKKQKAAEHNARCRAWWCGWLDRAEIETSDQIGLAVLSGFEHEPFPWGTDYDAENWVNQHTGHTWSNPIKLSTKRKDGHLTIRLNASALLSDRRDAYFTASIQRWSWLVSYSWGSTTGVFAPLVKEMAARYRTRLLALMEEHDAHVKTVCAEFQMQAETYVPEENQDAIRIAWAVAEAYAEQTLAPTADKTSKNNKTNKTKTEE